MAARASYISGGSDVAELTSAAQTCISLWEGVFSGADVAGTDLLDRNTMALVARSLALRGEFLGIIGEHIIPASDWDVSTRGGRPVAYRASIPEAGGGRTVTALAGEVIHIRIGSDPVAPWTGTAPLRRAALSANLLHEIEEALRDTFRDAPIGSQVLPLPDSSPEDMEAMRGAIRGRQGQTLIIEGVAQATAAGMNPQLGQRRDDLTPDLQKAEAAAIMAAARGAVAEVFGVPAAFFNPASTGPVFREVQRHLVQYTLSPLAKVISDEATAKLGGTVQIDVETPVQAYDTGGRARAMQGIIKALAEAQEAGIDPEKAMRLVGWETE
ncbi:phage portal protein [Roseovarius sp. MBR-78]|jgi:phage portal protein BeeE|uniref:phage portal protein n=1 Tax=Roseovarius sp. MBR-78 TaxID=3156460 RepID=UPI0033927CF2